MPVLYLLAIMFISGNSNYQVPSYYGHFSKNYFLPNQISQGVFTYFQYHYAVDIDYTNQTLYVANTKKHCIEQYDIKTGKKTILAGLYEKPGDKVGELNLNKMNGPKSVAFYQYSQEAAASESNMKILVVRNQTCSINNDGCLIGSGTTQQLSRENLRASPSIQLFPQTTTTRYLYFSDTQNHCIKKINLETRKSERVAGMCGESGLIDGPSQFNRFNRPANLGVTKLGIVYVYDEGNERMRKILPNGSVETLLNGACKQFSKTRKINNYQLNSILCYDNWIQKSTSAENFIVDEKSMDICIEHSSKC